ncbi:MAG: HAD family hydrolase [Alphaproteobacteria bacterium]|nr:HAD family hydrolase [Alphaproteobacteria bacterium]
MIKPRALFLDRDGVINADDGYTYKIEEFRFIDGIFDLCRAAHALDYLLIVVTNQAGIGRGYYTEDDFQRLTAWMQERFAAEEAPLTAIYHCPYHTDGIGEYRRQSDWRKPAPGMLLQAAEDFALDLPASLLIGDSEHDIVAARRAGLGAAVRFGDPATTPSDADAIFATHAEIRVWLMQFASRL